MRPIVVVQDKIESEKKLIKFVLCFHNYLNFEIRFEQNFSAKEIKRISVYIDSLIGILVHSKFGGIAAFPDQSNNMVSTIIKILKKLLGEFLSSLKIKYMAIEF